MTDPSVVAFLDQAHVEFRGWIQSYVSVARERLAAGAEVTQFGADLALSFEYSGFNEAALRGLLASAVIQLAQGVDG